MRNARATALKDAENFDEIVFCVESLGQLLLRKVGALHQYRPYIRELAHRSVLGEKLPDLLRRHHVPFDQLYETLRLTRNDAFHQGVRVRHLTESAIQLAIVLEDALMTSPDGPKDFVASDFMIRNPVVAELWQPVSLIRQTLLINSFSYLPVIVGEGGNKSFHLIADFAVTRYLRAAKDTKPAEFLAIPLAEILNVPGGLATIPAVCLCDVSEAISTVITRLSGEPVLVVDNLEKPTRLEGILTAYDLL